MDGRGRTRHGHMACTTNVCNCNEDPTPDTKHALACMCGVRRDRSAEIVHTTNIKAHGCEEGKETAIGECVHVYVSHRHPCPVTPYDPNPHYTYPACYFKVFMTVRLFVRRKTAGCVICGCACVCMCMCVRVCALKGDYTGRAVQSTWEQQAGSTHTAGSTPSMACSPPSPETGLCGHACLGLYVASCRPNCGGKDEDAGFTTRMKSSTLQLHTPLPRRHAQVSAVREERKRTAHENCPPKTSIRWRYNTTANQWSQYLCQLRKKQQQLQ